MCRTLAGVPHVQNTGRYAHVQSTSRCASCAKHRQVCLMQITGRCASCAEHGQRRVSVLLRGPNIFRMSTDFNKSHRSSVLKGEAICPLNLWACALTSHDLWKPSMASFSNRKLFSLSESLLFWLTLCQRFFCDTEVVSFLKSTNYPLLASGICSFSEPSELKKGECYPELIFVLWDVVAGWVLHSSSRLSLSCGSGEAHLTSFTDLSFGHVDWLFGKRISFNLCCFF